MTEDFHNKNGQTPEFAEKYLKHGWQPVPVPVRSKNPNFSGWQNFIASERDLHNHFNGKPQNIGVLLGAKSNGLIDVDLDSPEAVKIADFFLPKTESIFGRKNKPRSHRLYTSNFPKTEQFINPFIADNKQAMIVEIRSTGGQTIFPPSVHENGEVIEWSSEGEPLKVEANELRRAVALLASACIISKFWSKESHLRHHLSLAVSGALLRNGFTEAETKNFIKAICFMCDDEETLDRLQSVDTTALKLRNNKKVAGLPRLAEITDDKLVNTLCKWLEIEKPYRDKSNQEKANTTKESAKSTFNFTTLDELLVEPEELHSYVWEDVLISGGISICSAKPKVGKSTLARNLAVAVANGADFLGRGTKKGKVIYLCLEEKRSEIAKHFKQMGASGQDILIHTGKTPEDILQALKLACAEIEPILIIADPLSRVLRVRDFNDYALMARGLEPFIDLARDYNVHILTLHHDGKGGREGNDSILGSTAIFGGVDCHLQLKKRETGRTVASTQRYGIDLPETVIELDRETGLISGRGDLQSFLLLQKKSEVFDSISDTECLSEFEIKERVGGGSKGIISKAIRALYEEELLFRGGEGKKGHPYLYSKNLENLETRAGDFAENEKPTINVDKSDSPSGGRGSRFLGFSNNENPENPETNDPKNE